MMQLPRLSYCTACSLSVQSLFIQRRQLGIIPTFNVNLDRERTGRGYGEFISRTIICITFGGLDRSRGDIGGHRRTWKDVLGYYNSSFAEVVESHGIRRK